MGLPAGTVLADRAIQFIRIAVETRPPDVPRNAGDGMAARRGCAKSKALPVEPATGT